MPFAIPIRTAAAANEEEVEREREEGVAAEREERVEWQKGRAVFIAQLERLVKCDKWLQVWPNCIE